MTKIHEYYYIDAEEVLDGMRYDIHILRRIQTDCGRNFGRIWLGYKSLAKKRQAHSFTNLIFGGTKMEEKISLMSKYKGWPSHGQPFHLLTSMNHTGWIV